LERLRSLNVINDETFARNWVLSKTQTLGYGPKKVEGELRAKGVAQSLIRAAVSATFAQSDEKETATKLLEKRYHGKNLTDPKILRRAAAFLQRRGYSSNIISDLLGQPMEED